MGGAHFLRRVHFIGVWWVPKGQTKMATATDALLEQFISAFQNSRARGRAAAELIEQATSAPGLFAFGELLDLDSVKEVRKRTRKKDKKPTQHRGGNAPHRTTALFHNQSVTA